MAFLLLVDGRSVFEDGCVVSGKPGYEMHALSRFPISRPDGSGKCSVCRGES
jgi:hypothetical protein